ncbi:vesicle transport protein SEC20-like [Physella acuta]|uniref:vesicle transport protein SEC20-like n=1 Tax=Physella acuta TaxID=109671 RepID=UPI0027DBC228|nr:vesicle transport protein SEC20-like [Physella acuta]XP_059163257.1 vesicle transport protein SEC20-like [Physella acuta]XP_059163258.1 vesicle transport protein SEC20-like [Physella acuta]XP_059163259.1 vesicle transport protein SEC20-like [Physella acuta]
MAEDDSHVRVCLQEIVKLDLEAKAIIQDIRQNAESSETLDDLNAQGRKKISDLRDKIAELERIGLEKERDVDRDAILVNVESLRQKLSRTVSSLRQTTVSSKVVLDNYARNQLLAGATQLKKRTQGNKETLLKTANNITESLMSLNQTMAEQVKQSELNNSTLAGSSQVISDTHDEFHTMGGHIQHSQRLLTKYGRREFTDRLLILLALVFFFATVLYIMKKRLWPS